MNSGSPESVLSQIPFAEFNSPSDNLQVVKGNRLVVVALKQNFGFSESLLLAGRQMICSAKVLRQHANDALI